MRHFKTLEGCPVSFGDRITVKDTCNGITTEITAVITEENVESLVKKGVLVAYENNSSPLDLKKLVRFRLHDKIGVEAVGKIKMEFPGIYKSLFLREAALILDQKYDNNIRNCNVLYGIDLLTYRIFNVDMNRVKHFSYENFAAFRTPEDALDALNALLAKKKKIVHNA